MHTSKHLRQEFSSGNAGDPVCGSVGIPGQADAPFSRAQQQLEVQPAEPSQGVVNPSQAYRECDEHSASPRPKSVSLGGSGLCYPYGKNPSTGR